MNLMLILWIAWIVVAIMFVGRVLGAVCATMRVKKWIRKNYGRGLVFDGRDDYISLREITPFE